MEHAKLRLLPRTLLDMLRFDRVMILRETRKTVAGLRSQLGRGWVGRTRFSRPAATEVGWDWRDVLHEVGRDGLGADQPPERLESHESQ